MANIEATLEKPFEDLFNLKEPEPCLHEVSLPDDDKSQNPTRGRSILVDLDRVCSLSTRKTVVLRCPLINAMRNPQQRSSSRSHENSKKRRVGFRV